MATLGTEDIIGPTQTTLSNLVNSSIVFLPNLIAAIITLVIGVIIAEIVEKLTKRILVRVKIDSWARRSGIEKAIFHVRVSQILGTTAKWFVILIAIDKMSLLLTLPALNIFTQSLLTGIPSILVGTIIMVIGLMLGNFLSEAIKRKEFAFSELFAAGVYFIVVYFATVLALPKFGITNTDILVNTFNFIVAGISVGIAIAIGLGMGLALKDPIQDLVSPRRKK
jgi:hypothetical protein